MADRADPLAPRIAGRPRNGVWYQHHQAIDWHGAMSPVRLAALFRISMEELAHVGECSDRLHCGVCCYCVPLDFSEPTATEPLGPVG